MGSGGFLFRVSAGANRKRESVPGGL
jgi:hypothetical protein